MATKKKQAQPVVNDLFANLNADEQRQILAKFKRMALSMRTQADEFTKLIEYLEKPATIAVKDRKDENDEPKFLYLTRVPIPKDMYLTKRIEKYAQEYGFDRAEIPKVFTAFKEYYERTQAKWQDWTLVAYKWFRTDMQRRKQQLQNQEVAPRTSKSLREFR